MKIVLTALVALAMLAVVGVLLAGMLGMARTEGNAHRSNKLMQWRVILQGVALLLFVLLMTLMRG